MIQSTYAPQTWKDVEAAKVAPNAKGVAFQAAAGQPTTQDILIIDDALMRDIEILAQGAIFGDTINLQIVDINGVYSKAGSVLRSPVTDWNISPDSVCQGKYESIAPFKILGGVYLRVTYVSTGQQDVKVAINIVLDNVLV